MTDALGHREGCVDSETLAALADGRLDAAARERAEQHLASCPDCYEIFVDLARTWEGPGAEEATPVAVAFQPRPRFRRYLLGGGILAAAASIAAAFLVLGQRPTRDADRPELARLVAATAGPTRRFEARLTGGFAWGEVDASLRGGSTLRPSPEVLVAAGELGVALKRERSARNLAAFGASELVMGNSDGAVSALEEATGLEGRRAEYWSDLAGAYLAQSEATGQEAPLPRALNAVQTALSLQPSLPEALFNRALVLERMGLIREARETWTTYLASPDADAWRAEAQRRLNNLAKQGGLPVGPGSQARQELLGPLLRAWIVARPGDARSTSALTHLRATARDLDTTIPDRMPVDLVTAIERAEPSLPERRVAAAAHSAFQDGQAAMQEERYNDAQAAFASALPGLVRIGSPLTYFVRYQQGVITYRRQDTHEAYRIFTAVRRDIATRQYTSLLAQVDWMLGVISTLQGRMADAMAHFETGLESFERIRDVQGQARLQAFMATVQDNVGNPLGAWTLRVPALRRGPLSAVLLSAGLSASRQGMPRAGLVLAHAALEGSRAANSPPNIADALRAEASIRFRLGDSAGVGALLAEARRLVAAREERAWDRVRAEIDFAEAQTAGPGRLDVGLRAATAAIAYFKSEGSPGRLPALHAVRARLNQQAGHLEEAAGDVRAGLLALEGQRPNLKSGTEQVTFEEVERELLNQLVGLATTPESRDEAFVALDRSRGRDVIGADQPSLSPGRLGAVLPARTLVAVYVVQDHSSLVWTVTPAGLGFDRIAIGERELTDLVRAVTPPRDDDAAVKRLSRLVLEPLERLSSGIERWVIVADGPIRSLPFSRLELSGGKPVVSAMAVIFAPSVGSWASANRHGEAATTPTRFLAVGNPALNATEYPDLQDLPHAAQEAAEVSTRFGGSRTLLGGPDATREAVVRELATADVVHFAGHAVANPWVGDASYLALSGGPPSKLTAAEVRALPLTHSHLVVLAACDTAAGGGPTLASPLSLSRAFLAAGVTNVVGSLWRASDRASRVLFGHFYSELARTGDAAESLRRAQAALAASDDPTLARPSQWSGFVVMGGSRVPHRRTDNE